MNYAIIDTSNVVINMAVWDGESTWHPPDGCTAVLATTDARIGWNCIDGIFTPPSIEIVPEP